MPGKLIDLMLGDYLTENKGVYTAHNQEQRGRGIQFKTFFV